MTSFSGVTFVLFCFVFVSMLSLKPRPFVQSSFDMQAALIATRVSFLFFLFVVVVWRYDVASSESKIQPVVTR